MNISKISALFLLTLIAACDAKLKNNPSNPESLVADNFAFAEKQLNSMVQTLGETKKNPRNSEEDGSLRMVKSSDWTSGFFPGNLWYMYEYTKDDKWKIAAEKFTQNLENEQWNGTTHDMGFKMYCSFGNGYRLTENAAYKEILIQSAKTLITRFRSEVGAIRSWDHNGKKWHYPVIIDNMMNLELLFWATKATGDSIYYDIAVAHAETTLKNHFRENNSSYHVINYDTLSGAVLDKNTHQGYAHESSWARGQAWGLYGFTMVYRETGNQAFLDQAIKITEFILNNENMPEDLVPYWDFDAPNIPGAPRDASAAAVIASGLYELATFTEKEKYSSIADKIMISLSSPTYRSEIGENNNFLLMHSTGNRPKNSEVDVPIIYADYYWLEANLRKMKMNVE